MVSVSLPPSNFLQEQLPSRYPAPFSGLPERMTPRQQAANVGDDELTRWLDEHPSVVYVGFGTIMRLSRRQVDAIVEIADRLGPEHAVLWKVPARQQHLLPPAERLPGNLRVLAWVPSQHRVLAHPHVRVFFDHGAANAIHEAVHFAVPQLVMPFWLDCPDGAVRAVDSGVALSVERADSLDVEDVLGKLERLLGEETFRARARLWSRRMRQAGGVTPADLVLRHRDEAAARRGVGLAVG
ncbi:glycosyltransferase [Micromonospora sp. NPDC047812]|uniref:glycosyltransferase n=1 Tax=Micromonospora sp. NPDC047812 TaxID=3155742 RepID=UPI0034564EA3